MYAEIDDALISKALRINHSNNGSQLINSLLQDFISHYAVKEQARRYEREKQEDSQRWTHYKQNGDAIEQKEMLAWMDNLSRVD
jgi:Arc/MetJ family transcription regulator